MLGLSQVLPRRITRTAIHQTNNIGLFGIIGSIIGGNAAFLMSQNVLNTVFAIFLLIVSFNLYLKKD